MQLAHTDCQMPKPDKSATQIIIFLLYSHCCPVQRIESVPFRILLRSGFASMAHFLRHRRHNRQLQPLCQLRDNPTDHRRTTNGWHTEGHHQTQCRCVLLLLRPWNDNPASVWAQLRWTDDAFGFDRIGQRSDDGNGGAADTAAAALVECQRQLGQTVLAVQIVGRVDFRQIDGLDLEARIKVAQLVAVAGQNAGWQFAPGVVHWNWIERVRNVSFECCDCPSIVCWFCVGSLAHCK